MVFGEGDYCCEKLARVGKLLTPSPSFTYPAFIPSSYLRLLRLPRHRQIGRVHKSGDSLLALGIMRIEPEGSRVAQYMSTTDFVGSPKKVSGLAMTWLVTRIRALFRSAKRIRSHRCLLSFFWGVARSYPAMKRCRWPGR